MQQSASEPDPARVPWLDRAAYPFRRRFISVEGARIHLVDEGEGPAVLLSHGTPTWSWEWRHVITALRASHRVIAPDHLGFGLSDRPPDADYSPEAHARRWSALVDALALPSYALVVHDFGGPFALARALSRPHEVERVALLNTFLWAPEDDDELRPKARAASTWAFRMLYRHLNFSQRVLVPFSYGDRRKYDAAQRAAIEGPFLGDTDARERVLYALARSMTSSRSFFASLWDERAALADKPLLALWGMRDPAFTPRSLARFRDAWPHLSVVPLDEAGHWPQEEAPSQVSDALRVFLAR